MEENEIIEADIEEEEVVDDVDDYEEPIEKEPLFTDEEIDKKVKVMKEKYRKEGYTYALSLLAKEIAENSKEYLDNDTYYWVMYIYSLKYQHEDNPNAERYILVRLSAVLATENKPKKQPKALTFVTSDLDEDIRTRIKGETYFLKEDMKKLRREFTIMEVGILVLFAVIFHFLFDFSIAYSVGVAVIAGALNFLVSYRGIEKNYLEQAVKANKEYCHDQEIMDFDLPVSRS